VEDIAMGVLRMAENMATKRMVRMLLSGWMKEQV
jgi:hypothetical protein